jgi:hypothetical protein
VIKAAGKTGLGVPLLLLGLSGENVTRLAAGEPIHISAAQMRELGLPQIKIIIHYGRTEQDILDEMKAHGVGPGKVRDERRRKNVD